MARRRPQYGIWGYDCDLDPEPELPASLVRREFHLSDDSVSVRTTDVDGSRYVITLTCRELCKFYGEDLLDRLRFLPGGMLTQIRSEA